MPHIPKTLVECAGLKWLVHVFHFAVTFPKRNKVGTAGSHLAVNVADEKGQETVQLLLGLSSAAVVEIQHARTENEIQDSQIIRMPNAQCQKAQKTFCST